MFERAAKFIGFSFDHFRFIGNLLKNNELMVLYTKK